MIDVPNEEHLPYHLRLGLAYCRLNCYEWDDIVGPKPSNWESLPTVSKRSLFGNKKPSKHDYLKGPMQKILRLVGRHTISLCWWRFVLKRNATDFLQWHLEEFGYPFKDGPNRL